MVGRERKETKGRERKGREGGREREREYKPFHVILQYEINIVEKL